MIFLKATKSSAKPSVSSLLILTTKPPSLVFRRYVQSANSSNALYLARTQPVAVEQDLEKPVALVRDFEREENILSRLQSLSDMNLPNLPSRSFKAAAEYSFNNTSGIEYQEILEKTVSNR